MPFDLGVEQLLALLLGGLVLLVVLVVVLLLRGGRSARSPEADLLRLRVDEQGRELMTVRQDAQAGQLAAQQRERDLASELARSQSLLETQRAQLEQQARQVEALPPLRDAQAQLNAQVAALRDQLGEARERMTTLEAERVQLREQVQQLGAQNAAHRQSLEDAARRREEQERWINERTQAFEVQIRELTARLFKQQAEEAQKLHRTNLDEVLAPFRQNLVDFRTQVETFAREQATEREGLRSHVATLAGVHSSLSAQTQALTQALTTQNKQAGNWGETQLIRLLESVGFVEGLHYRCQVTVVGADDVAVQRPDVILDLPDDRQVVIDAKVSIAAWTRAQSAEDDDGRRQGLKEHVASMRRHVTDLSSKDYARSPDIHTLDFVVMFVPVEAAYVAAASEDPGLFQDAFGKGVIIASPTLLLALLKLVNSLWNMHKQEENAQAVLELGTKLHAKVVSFAENFEAIGTRLASVGKAYDDARGQLLTGKGNAVRLLEQLEKRGISKKKAIPAGMQREALASDDDDDEAGDSVSEPSSSD